VAPPATGHVVGPEKAPDGLDAVGRGGDHHAADTGRRAQPPDRVDQQGLAAEKPQRLGAARAEPDAKTRGRNEDRDVTTQFSMRGHVAVLGNAQAR